MSQCVLRNTCLSRIAGWHGLGIVDSRLTMRCLVPHLSALLLVCGSAVFALPTRASAEPPKGQAVELPRLRLSWFNSLDRSFSLSVAPGPVVVTLHSTSGTLLTTLHKGALGEREILRVSEDLPPGVYVLCIRQNDKQSLERVTLF